MNPRQLVRQSIVNGEKAWQESRIYSYLKLSVDKQFGPNGEINSTDTDLYRIIPVNGDSFQEHIQHDGESVSSEDLRKEQHELERRANETPEERAERLEKAEHFRAFYYEVPDAFDFKIIGQEKMPTGPAWVLQATPHPGYQPKTRYAEMFHKMAGKLWIDQKDVQWVKADAVATANVYFGYFIARLSKGSRIIVEQTRLPDGTWLPKRIEARADARTFLFFNHNFEEDITYSDYRKDGNQAASAAARTAPVAPQATGSR
jgi:hypothetical protein